MRLILPTVIAFGAMSSLVYADTLIANRNIRAQTVIQPEDLALSHEPFAGALSAPEHAIGLETKIAIYAGRPIRPEDIGPPAIVQRNQIISLAFTRGALRIEAEGRALERAAVGDVIRVMNASSKSIVTARIGSDGTGFVNAQ